MKTLNEVLEYISENDVKFVKLSFCDICGRIKNVSINSSYFGDACRSGYAVDSSATGLGDRGDLLLFPQPQTFSPMPWRPSSGAVVNVMCSIKYPDGQPFEGDCGRLLEDAEKAFAETGYAVSFTTESEFYITKLNVDGEPTLIPVDNAGYLDAAPLDRCENLRRDIVFTLEEMGMKPLSSHHEHGRGQNAVVFQANTAFLSAVNTTLFRSAVRNIAYNNGLYATFAPAPIDGEIGSNFRIVVELTKDGAPVRAKDARRFAEGLLARLPELTVFTNPTRNSYKRLLHRGTPARLTLNGDRSAIRLCSGGAIEIFSADTACNPFIVLALVLYAGADALAGNAPELVADSLPQSLSDAAEIAASSEFLAEHLPEQLLCDYVRIKRAEATELKRDDVIRDGI